MKVVIHLLLLTISVSALATPRLVLSKGNRLIFEGKVLAIGPSPGYGSGGVQAYQLVKYHINHLCEGDYDGAEIVVDHLLLDPDELKDLKIGDVACVGVTKSKDINSRWNDGQLRYESDKVDAYYIALDTFIRNCRCRRPKSSLLPSGFDESVDSLEQYGLLVGR